MRGAGISGFPLAPESADFSSGIKINYLLLRMMTIKYVGQYRDVTRGETGHTGPWFYSFVISMILAFEDAIAGLAVHSL